MSGGGVKATASLKEAAAATSVATPHSSPPTATKIIGSVADSSSSSSSPAGGDSSSSSSMTENGDTWSADLQVLFVLAAHWILSSTITFSNNFLVDHSLPNLSVLLSALQTVTTTLLVAPFVWWRQRQVVVQLSLRDVLLRNRAFLPLCCSFIGMLTFNRMSLRQVGVACLQISRSLTVVFTLALTYWLLSLPVRRSSLFCCATVVAGFVIGVNQSLDSVTFKGFVFGTISSLFASVETTLTKMVLPGFDNSPMLLTCMMNAVCSVMFIPLLLATGQLAVLCQHWSQVFTLNFLCTLVLSNLGTAAFGVLTYRVIHVTSPLTLVISNSAHTTAQTLLAVCYFHKPTSLLWWMSVLLILLGTTGYAVAKARDMRHQHHQTQLLNRERTAATSNGKIQSV